MNADEKKAEEKRLYNIALREKERGRNKNSPSSGFVLAMSALNMCLR